MNGMITKLCLSLILSASPLLAADRWNAPSKAQIDAIYPQLETLYMDLHRNPELSGHEEKTAAKIAGNLRQLGFEVTTDVGGTGVVGVLKNGEGPTLMVRAELDALPVPEKTGLSYASHVMTTDDNGVDVPVMHACGHDLHMAVAMGTAALLSQSRDRWNGTFMYVGQPAEERLTGARAMLDAGLFTRFPRPDFALAVHDMTDLPAGRVGYVAGFALAGSDALDVTIYGRGGHAAMPELTVDPIVIAARTILTWQTIISRENAPQDPAVITVGSIQGGTKRNIIADEVRLQLTVRSYKEDVRKHLLASIERIAKAEAAAAGAEKEPAVEAVEHVGPLYNDPGVSERVMTAVKQVLGDANVAEQRPKMVSDDFAEYGQAGVPSLLFLIGAVDPTEFEAAHRSGKAVPGPHSPFFAPAREPTLRTAILAESAAVLELLRKP